MDYYRILQIGPDATAQEIKKSYLQLCKVYHPDITTLPKEEAEKVMQSINEAYRVLSKEPLRQAYDEERRPVQKKKEGMEKREPKVYTYSAQTFLAFQMACERLRGFCDRIIDECEEGIQPHRIDKKENRKLADALYERFVRRYPGLYRDITEMPYKKESTAQCIGMVFYELALAYVHGGAIKKSRHCLDEANRYWDKVDRKEKEKLWEEYEALVKEQKETNTSLRSYLGYGSVALILLLLLGAALSYLG